MRLASAPAARGRRAAVPVTGSARRLAAHLCRCTGWQTIVEAARAVASEVAVDGSGSGRDLAAATGGRRSKAASPNGWDLRSCSGTAVSPTTPARRTH